MALTTAQAAEYLNETLEKLGNDYQIDTTSDATLTEGFKTVGAFPPAMKSNILDMQTLILVQRAYSSMFDSSKNPTRRFWRDAIDYGGGMRETFVKLIEAEDSFWAEDFDGSESDSDLADKISRDLVKFKKDEVINKIHPVNKKFRLKMSISDLEYAKVFTPDGYASFVDRKMTNFQESAEAHLMDIAIGVMKDMITNNHVIFNAGHELNTANGVTTFVEALNTTADGMATLSDAYNFDGVRTTSTSDDLYLVTTPEVFNRIKSRGYSNAFNLAEYENKNKIIMLPAGTVLGTHEGKSIGAMLVDYRAILIAVKYWEVQPFIVSNTDYRNTFLKAQLVTGYTEFFNAVAFVTGDVDFFTDAQQGYANIMVSGISYNDANRSIKVNGRNLEEFAIYKNDDFFETAVEEHTETTFAVQLPVGSFVEARIDYVRDLASGFTMIGLEGNTSIALIPKIRQSYYETEDPHSIEFYVTANMVSFEFANTSSGLGGLGGGGLSGIQGES